MANCLQPCRKISPPGKASYKVPDSITDILRSTDTLEEDDFYVLIFELIWRAPHSAEKMKKVMNFARDKKFPAASLELDKLGEKEVCGQQRNVDPGTSFSSKKSDAVPTVGLAASNVPLICRGDLAAAANNVFIDVENVTLRGKHDQVAGGIAIVDEKGRLIFWCFIQRDNVCMYNTAMTGLDKTKMEMGLPLSNVQYLLSKILWKKTVWGAALNNDWKSLGLDPANCPFEMHSRDLQKFFIDPKGNLISLALLSEHFLGENKQEKNHSSNIDARLTCIAYHKMIKLQAMGLTRFSCPAMDQLRTESSSDTSKKKNYYVWEKCKCQTGQKKSKNKRNKQFGGFMDISLDDL